MQALILSSWKVLHHRGRKVALLSFIILLFFFTVPSELDVLMFLVQAQSWIKVFGEEQLLCWKKCFTEGVNQDWLFDLWFMVSFQPW